MYRPHWKYGDLTHDVGQSDNVNGWNLYDMMANVWEWTADWYSEDVPSGLTVDPTGPADGKERATRGASFNTPEQYARIAIRSKHDPAKKDFETGFRCVWQ
jgi:formylglycine-generating enzyme required for sulfatase activity